MTQVYLYDKNHKPYLAKRDVEFTLADLEFYAYQFDGNTTSVYKVDSVREYLGTKIPVLESHESKSGFKIRLLRAEPIHVNDVVAALSLEIVGK